MGKEKRLLSELAGRDSARHRSSRRRRWCGKGPARGNGANEARGAGRRLSEGGANGNPWEALRQQRQRAPAPGSAPSAPWMKYTRTRATMSGSRRPPKGLGPFSLSESTDAWGAALVRDSSRWTTPRRLAAPRITDGLPSRSPIMLRRRSWRCCLRGTAVKDFAGLGSATTLAGRVLVCSCAEPTAARAASIPPPGGRT